MPVAAPVKPGPELLRKCEWPATLPGLDKSIVQNGEALQEMALKLSECISRHAKLVEWVEDPTGRPPPREAPPETPKLGGDRE